MGLFPWDTLSQSPILVPILEGEVLTPNAALITLFPYLNL